jgi:hypothetical protein
VYERGASDETMRIGNVWAVKKRETDVVSTFFSLACLSPLNKRKPEREG